MPKEAAEKSLGGSAGKCASFGVNTETMLPAKF